MARACTTGPVTIYVAPKAKGFKGQPLFLGTGEVAPTSEIREEFEPIMNDLTGSRVPYDEIFEGEHGFTVVDLTRFNEDVLTAIESLPNRTTSERGAYTTQDVGALMLTEGLAYPVWLLNTANGRFLEMPDGDHFFASWLVGPKIRTKGTRANKVHCVWRHLPVYDPKSGGIALYDHNMAAVAGIAVN